MRLFKAVQENILMSASWLFPSAASILSISALENKLKAKISADLAAGKISTEEAELKRQNLETNFLRCTHLRPE